MALGLELLATNRQMEKRRQPRSQALTETALSYSFWDLEGPPCSGFSWEGEHRAQREKQEEVATGSTHGRRCKIWFSFLRSRGTRMRLKILAGAHSSEEHKKETGLQEEDGQWRTLVSGKG